MCTPRYCVFDDDSKGQTTIQFSGLRAMMYLFIFPDTEKNLFGILVCHALIAGSIHKIVYSARNTSTQHSTPRRLYCAANANMRINVIAAFIKHFRRNYDIIIIIIVNLCVRLVDARRPQKGKR